MQVDYLTALKVFQQLPDEQKSPYLHPYYVCLDATRDQSLEPVFFVYTEEGKIFYYPFHIAGVPGTEFFDIQAPYAYGGPISSSHDPRFLSRAGSQYLSWCQAKNILAEFVRFHPLLANWRYYPGELQDMRETVWIDLQREELFPSYTARVRTAIRKAQKNNLRIEWVQTSDYFQAFAEFYTQAMDCLQAEPFYYFSREYFQKLQYWQHSYLAICWKDESTVAAALFLKEAHIMEYHLSAANSNGKRFNASNLIIHQAAIKARQLNCRALCLGGGTDNRSNNSLLFFKAGFSKQRACFRIGKIIHAPEAYKRMQEDWRAVYGRCNDKVLFYRFAGG